MGNEKRYWVNERMVIDIMQRKTIQRECGLVAGILLMLLPLVAVADTETPTPQIVISTIAPVTDETVLSQYRTLETGMSGEDVELLKLRMYELGYYYSEDVSDSYNGLMAERIMWLQRLNGLEETGVATPALQALIYSDTVVYTENTPEPTAAPTPTAVPLPIQEPNTSPVLPARTEDGFLSPDAEDDPYVFTDADEGHYIYLSQDLFVEIKRYTDPNLTLVWYETEIKVQNEETLHCYLTEKNTNSYRFSTPEALAAANNAVVALTDDFFNYRLYNSEIPGIIIRNGEIISNTTYQKTDTWPPLDTLAVFLDGSMKTFGKNEYTAQEYLDMGAVQVFAFGPILVQDGELGERIQDDTYYHYREPRCALGMIAPGHYLTLTVNGRTDDSSGAYLLWLGQRMIQRGVTEALNLDGGGTTSLVFMGETVNEDGTGSSSVRSISSIIAFGTYIEDAR